MKLTRQYWKLIDAFDDDIRIICMYGGSSSSKTVSALSMITTLAFNVPKLVFSIIGESYPVLKKTVLRDWERYVMGESYREDFFNKQDFVYNFPNGSIFQFVPADDEKRFHGMRQDYVLMDEAYFIKKAIFDQVEIRTRKRLILTWNPVSPFWGKELEDRPDSRMIHSTYRDNPFLDKSIKKSLELRAKTDDNFYRVYVLGEYGSLEGLIFKEGQNWRKVEKLPEEFQWRYFGLDFGFTHDPSALIEIRYSDGQLWLKEHLYSTGMINREVYEKIAPIVLRDRIWADSAEPKSIVELRRYGLNIQGASKGKDSVKHGINVLKGYQMNVTKDSLNLIKEFRNFSWLKKDEGFEEKPADNWNHLIDALRYGIEKLRVKRVGRYSIS